MKKRCTIFSLINSVGEKFKQFAIVKGAHGARVEVSIQMNNDESNYFSAQKNAWTDEEQLESWLANVWWPIAQSIEEPKLLRIDSYPLHSAFESKFSQYNTIMKFIPVGLGPYMKPIGFIKILGKSFS